jgi:hypothetical protein
MSDYEKYITNKLREVLPHNRIHEAPKLATEYIQWQIAVEKQFKQQIEAELAQEWTQ